MFDELPRPIEQSRGRCASVELGKGQTLAEAPRPTAPPAVPGNRARTRLRRLAAALVTHVDRAVEELSRHRGRAHSLDWNGGRSQCAHGRLGPRGLDRRDTAGSLNCRS